MSGSFMGCYLQLSVKIYYENCESDILSLSETDNTSSTHEDFTDIDNWMKSSSNINSFTIADLNSSKEYVEVESISPDSTGKYQEDKKPTNQLSQGDSSILHALLRFLQNTNQPVISATELNLLDSKLPTSTLESSLPKSSFQQHNTTVHSVLLNMDDSSAFQSWFNLSSSLGNARRKRESLSSNSSSSSLSCERNPENISQHSLSPLTTTSPVVDVTSSHFTITSLPTTTVTTGLKRETTIISSGVSSSNRSSPTSDFSPQSSICSLSSSPLGAATEFLKSVVKYSAAALNNFDLLSLDQTDDMPVSNWCNSLSSSKQQQSNKDNNSTTNQNSSSSSSPRGTSPALSIFQKSIITTNTSSNNYSTNNNIRTVWDNERLREVISAKPLPHPITETIAYNLR
ncbi:cement protein 3B variant 3 [Schistosoma japonicum]|nr:cement protein 3B variant 3 [Schistosoma japonicum]